ncbi:MULTISPECIES: SRPBCC family protein [unclassified Roseovarius]|uniref:SRPBCC family protein n=1 Tax=unclassified Roseovarius TaxID=2614913 RepID=UPI00273FCEA0|nr:SRPBCC family protein [Roseovarius sp. MMSF_3350]
MEHDYRVNVGTKGRDAALMLGAGLLTVGAVAYWQQTRTPPRLPGVPDSAPGRTSRQSRYGDYAVSGRSVTINRPIDEVYAFWRDFSNLAGFMSHVEKVETEGDMTTWTIAAPGNQSVTVRSRIVSDRENEEIAWRSVEESDIDTEGKVMFREAPGGRGTEVEAVIAYVPPAGRFGQMIAKLFQREPRVQGRHELKRLKMLMETGEITTSQNRKTD